MSKVILFVEDNKKVQAFNKIQFEEHGYSPRLAFTLSEAKESMRRETPDIIILDIILPDGNGLEFLRDLRENRNVGIPVLMLTGMDRKEDVVNGLNAGSDDYLVKPYDFPELLARAEALLRRAERVPEKIVKGRLTLDVTASMATVDGIDLMLTKKDFNLLLLFVKNEGRVVDSEYLYERIWQAPMADDNQALKSSLKRLRPKIEGSGWFIATSKGEGFCFEQE